MNAGEIFHRRMGREPTEAEWQIYAELKKTFSTAPDTAPDDHAFLVDIWCSIASQRQAEDTIREAAENAEKKVKNVATEAIEAITQTAHRAIKTAVAQYAHHEDIWAQAFRGVFLFLLLFATLIAGIGIGYISSTLSLGLTLIHIGTRALPILGTLIVGIMWLSSPASRKRDIRYMVLVAVMAGIEIFILL
jgi:hypothetical protein